MSERPVVRVGALFGASAVAAAISLPLLRVCLAGPYGALPEEVQILMATRITEAIPATVYMFRMDPVFFSLVGPALGALIISAFYGKLNMKTDSGEYTLSYLDADEYPDIPSFPGSDTEKEDINEITISGNELRYAFERAAFAMSKEEMRPAMMGMLFEFTDDGLRYVATDGHRLVNLLKENVKLDKPAQYIVPERAVTVCLKLFDEKDVKLYLSKTHISFMLNDIELITRLIGQKYPDYSSVIPLENEFKMKVKTKELHSIIKRMMLFSTSNTRRVKFSIGENKLEISAEDLDLGTSGKEVLKVEYTGDPIDIGFNSQYVNDVLTHSGAEEEVIFKLHSPTKAVVIEPKEQKEKQQLMMLLMPVRLNN